LTALGGVTSLAKAAEVTGLVAMAVERIEPWRDEGLVEHEIKTLLSQRLYLGACGHTDALDCSLFKDDPGLKSVLGLEPDGPSLPSQSTHTRMENSMSEDSLNKLEELPLEYFLSSHEHTPRELTIYFDGSAIRTYGSQQKFYLSRREEIQSDTVFPTVGSNKRRSSAACKATVRQRFRCNSAGGNYKTGGGNFGALAARETYNCDGCWI